MYKMRLKYGAFGLHFFHVWAERAGVVDTVTRLCKLRPEARDSAIRSVCELLSGLRFLRLLRRPAAENSSSNFNQQGRRLANYLLRL
jgi:hypothetical protein